MCVGGVVEGGGVKGTRGGGMTMNRPKYTEASQRYRLHCKFSFSYFRHIEPKS